MAMTPREETKSFHVCSRNESGEDVFVANATYSSRGVYINLEMIGKEYCNDHPDEVQSAISSFLVRLNALLEESNLPIIQVAK